MKITASPGTGKHLIICKDPLEMCVVYSSRLGTNKVTGESHIPLTFENTQLPSKGFSFLKAGREV